MTADISMEDREGRPFELAAAEDGVGANGRRRVVLQVAVTNPSGSVTDPTGLATEAKQDAILAALAALSAKLPSPTTRTITASTVTTAGSVPIGAKAVSFVNEGSAQGTVLGAPIKAGGSWSLSVDGGDQLPELAYDATGTSFTITVTR